MNIKKRIIPAKPRSKELYFERGGTSSRISSSSSSSVGGSSVEILTGEEGEKITNFNVFSAEYINTHLNPLRDWFKLDEDGNLYTERNFYSMLGLSGYGNGQSSSGGEIIGDVYWNDILNKPETFLPSAHNHSVSNITDLTTNYYNKNQIDNLLNNVGGSNTTLQLTTPTIATLTVDNVTANLSRSTHSHYLKDILGVSINPVTNYPDGYVLTWTQSTGVWEPRAVQASGNNGTVVSWGNTTNNLSPLTVDGVTKTVSLSGHTHSQYLTSHQDISHLATKSELNGKANTSHTHIISDITNLQNTLNNKVDKVNGKSLILDSEIIRLASVTNQDISNLATKSELTTGLSGKANTVHTHSITDIANLQDVLNIKANIDNPIFTTQIKTPKIDLGNDWTIETSSNELVFKQSGQIKNRMTENGLISTGGLTGYGAGSGSSNSSDYLLLNSSSNQIIHSPVEFSQGASFDGAIYMDNLNVSELNCDYNLNGLIIKASLEFRLGSNWTVSEQNGNLVFKKNGVIKHTING